MLLHWLPFILSSFSCPFGCTLRSLSFYSRIFQGYIEQSRSFFQTWTPFVMDTHSHTALRLSLLSVISQGLVSWRFTLLGGCPEEAWLSTSLLVLGAQAERKCLSVVWLVFWVIKYSCQVLSGVILLIINEIIKHYTLIKVILTPLTLYYDLHCYSTWKS